MNQREIIALLEAEARRWQRATAEENQARLQTMEENERLREALTGRTVSCSACNETSKENEWLRAEVAAAYARGYARGYAAGSGEYQP